MELKRADGCEGRYEVAADWLQRLDDPQLPQEDLQAWLEWFEASDDNRQAFEELQTFRQRFRVLPPAQRDQLKRCVTPPAEPVRSEPVRARSKSGGPWALAAAISAMAIGVAAWWVAQTHGMQTYAATDDRHRTVVLDDGSSLVLAASSVVDVTYSPTRRMLNIQRGEAYFEVAPNRLRPFMVQAGEVRVTAVGTAFNVQRRSDQVTVTVTEGKVRISQSGESPRIESSADAASATEVDRELVVGQQAVLPIEAPVVATTAAASGSAPDWSGDHASFINAPLREVLPVINRHASTRLSIDDPRVADLTYSGTIFRSHVDEWILSLPHVFAVRTVPLEDGTVTLVSRDRAHEP